MRKPILAGSVLLALLLLLFGAASAQAAASKPVLSKFTTPRASVRPLAAEFTSPSGPYAGQRPKGVVEVIHGGGWFLNGPGALRSMDASVNRFRARGYAVVNIDYALGAGSLPDALAGYDLAQRKFPNLRVCTMGLSAGGHLALMVAAWRPVACVIDEAAPTDLLTITDPCKTLAQRYFAPTAGGLPAWSPTVLANQINAAVFSAAATNDPVVPYTQALKIRAALKGRTNAGRSKTNQLVVMNPGPTNFVHSGVVTAELNAERLQERSFLQRNLG